MIGLILYIALTAIYLAFGTSYYIFIPDYLQLHGKSLTGVIIDYNFSPLLVSSLSFMIKKINASIVSRLEMYYERISLEKEMMTINETVQYKIGRDLHDDLGQHLVAIASSGIFASICFWRGSRHYATDMAKVQDYVIEEG